MQRVDVWLLFTCGFQDAGLGATGSLLLLLLNLLWKFNLSPLGMPWRTDIRLIGKIGQDKAIGEIRSGLWGHLEAKTASKDLLEKIRMLSQSSVNEFLEVFLIFFCQRVSGGFIIFCQWAQKPNIPKNQPLQWLPQVYCSSYVLMNSPVNVGSYVFKRNDITEISA